MLYQNFRINNIGIFSPPHKESRCPNATQRETQLQDPEASR
jgi:hypothetical protein